MAEMPPCEKGHPTEVRPKRIAPHRRIGVVYCRRCRRWRPDSGWPAYTTEIRDALRHGGWRPWSEVIHV